MGCRKQCSISYIDLIFCRIPILKSHVLQHPLYRWGQIREHPYLFQGPLISVHDICELCTPLHRHNLRFMGPIHFVPASVYLSKATLIRGPIHIEINTLLSATPALYFRDVFRCDYAFWLLHFQPVPDILSGYWKVQAHFAENPPPSGPISTVVGRLKGSFPATLCCRGEEYRKGEPKTGWLS